MRALVIILSLAVSGCTVYAGPAGLAVAVFGSAYTHRESFADPPKTTTEDGSGGNLKSWTTAVVRTFGTVDVEATVDTNSERLALTGDGMSTVMGGVIGQDVGAKLGQIVACSIQPAQPACVGFSGAFGSSEKSAADYLEAFRSLRESRAASEDDEGDPEEEPPPTE